VAAPLAEVRALAEESRQAFEPVAASLAAAAATD